MLGKGDMLFYPAGASKPTRVQGAFVDDKEVEKIVDFLKANGGESTYNTDIIESIEKANTSDKEKDLESATDDETDPFLMEAIETVVETGQASTSFIPATVFAIAIAILPAPKIANLIFRILRILNILQRTYFQEYFYFCTLSLIPVFYYAKALS